MEKPLILSVLPTSSSHAILSFGDEREYGQLLLQDDNFSTLKNGALSGNQSEGELFSMILKAVFMGLLMFMALFGNALVIVSVIRIRRLRTVTNYFVVSLAVADFLVAALVMPFNAIQEILKRWIFPEWVCYFFNSNDVLFCTASVLNLCMVAVDRYVAIVQPLRYRQVMSKRAASLMIASAWAASLGISYVPIHLNWHLPNFEAVHNPGHCDFKPSAVYSLVSSAISFWLPTFVILFVYGRIYVIALNQAKEMRALDQHMATICSPAPVTKGNPSTATVNKITSPASGCSMPNINAANNCDQEVTESVGRKQYTATVEKPLSRPSSMVTFNTNVQSPTLASTGAFSSQSPNKQQSSHKESSRSESRATKILAIVIGCYLLCWMPFFVWLNVMAICKNCPESGILGTVLFWIGYANSTFNPVIYAFFSREFRNAFIASLRIDKWTRAFCFKLTKQNQSSKHSPPAKVTVPAALTTVRVSGKPSPPLEQQIVRRRQLSNFYGQQKKQLSISVDTVHNDEAKQPLVSAPEPSLVALKDDYNEEVVVYPPVTPQSQNNDKSLDDDASDDKDQAECDISDGQGNVISESGERCDPTKLNNSSWKGLNKCANQASACNTMVEETVKTTQVRNGHHPYHANNVTNAGDMRISSSFLCDQRQ